MTSCEEVHPDVARRLLREQLPALADLPVAPAFPGWDNTVYRLGSDLSIRLPRRPEACWLLERELRWVPALPSGLPLALPEIVEVGQPTEYFPRPWYVARWVAGEPSDRSPIQDSRAAAELAGFLQALHVPALPEVPTGERGADLRSLSGGFQQLADDSRAEIDVAPLEEIWRRATAAPVWSGPPVWVHGDLHPANVISRDGRLAGVVDFGTLSSGDPAVDLAAAWLVLPDGSADELLDHYGADTGLRERAMGRAAGITLVLLAVGRAGERGLPGGKVSWGEAGRRALTRLTAAA